MLRTLGSRLSSIKSVSPGYISALISGYLLMAANIAVQFGLTPLYLKYLGEQQFGLLMIILNFINFAAIGITWMSGGLVRVVGEFWVNADLDGLRDTMTVGKYVYTFYALLLVIGGGILLAIKAAGTSGESLTVTMLLAGIYLIMNYEALPERQAFAGINNQAVGNYFEMLRVVFFAFVTFLLLPELQELNVVWYALMGSVLLQRLLTTRYWRKHVGGTGWRKFTPEMKKLFRRLAGKQGAGYFIYGVFLLLLQADTMIIGMIGGAEAAGKFVLLWKIPEALGLLLWKVPSSIEPRVISLDASGDHNSLRAIFTTGRRWFLVLVLAVSLFYMLAGQWLAQLWVGQFAPESDWMYIAGGLAFFCNTFARWPISFAYGMIRLSDLVRIAGIEVGGKICLIILLFPHLGIAAPLVASVIMHVIYVGWKYQMIVQFDGVPVK